MLRSNPFLRGADAVYVSVAHLSDAVLLTYDKDVVERAVGTIRVMTPDTDTLMRTEKDERMCAKGREAGCHLH